MKKNLMGPILMLIMVSFFSVGVFSQTTEFTYQGDLQNAGSPANGSYDFEFLLFDAVTAGAQTGSMLTRSGVTVTNGIFSVKLDFGSQFPGADRFLEIHVKQTGGGGFTPLTPRQAVTSAPYAVKSLAADTATNATQLGGVAANQYLTITNGNANYIQNSTAQQAANFNVTGTGVAYIFNAANHYQIDGERVLSIAGNMNVFAGRFAGAANIFGSSNSFFGTSAGQANLGGSQNAFVGGTSGFNNTEGTGNAFFGSGSGGTNITGSYNTVIGYGANVGQGDLTNSTAIGANSTVSASDSLVLGNNVNVGIGISAPVEKLQVAGGNVRWSNSILQDSQGGSIELGGTNAIAGSGIPFIDFHQNGLTEDYNVRLINDAPGQLTAYANFNVQGSIKVSSLGSAGSTALCSNASNDISTCSSSARYKNNINPFRSGLDLVRKFRPVTFAWKDGGMLDMGLVAEEVAAVEPLLTTTNDKGEIEGVKYDRIGVVLVNAVQEQQAQIEAQQKQIEQQRKQIESLTKIVCAMNSNADICQQLR